MTRLFISHSSQDNFEALAFRDWLTQEGWSTDDVFLDLHGLGAGERWRDALAKANERCEVVVLLASPAALSSTECRVEIRMAEDYGKEIVVAILHLLKADDPALGPFRERQIVDLSQEPREAIFTVAHDGQQKTIAFHRPTLARIKARLDQLGISPTSFSWRPGDLNTASPFPGLKGFESGEAALFFGRAGDISRGLSELRKLRRLPNGQVLVIQAASGAGKSSFLKAGLWPRLARDPEFAPLAILRPATGILTGDHGIGRQFPAFFAARGSAAHRGLTPAAIHHELRKPDDAALASLSTLINQAIEIGYSAQRVVNPEASPPTPLIAVDQAEELFAADDLEESTRFLKITANLLNPSRTTGPKLTVPPLFLWTIRADSMDALLHAIDAAGLKPPTLFPLPPIPRDAYRDIIVTPLDVANKAGMKLAIDPLLVDTLVAKSTGADALPLLAFTLRQLLADNRAGIAANLTLASFEAAGGMEGVLAARLAAAQRAGGGGPEALRQLFLPHLCTWDADANPPGAKRLIAREADLLAGSRASLAPLVQSLVSERLLTRSGDVSGAVTLEVAHEALLRQPPLSDWLEADREFLVWRETVSRARAGFEANSRGLLIGRELEVARGWLEARTHDVPAPNAAFIEESAAADEARRREEEEKERQYREAELRVARAREESARRLARRTSAGLLMVLALLFVAAGAGLWAWKEQREALRAADLAEEQKRQAIGHQKVAELQQLRAENEARRTLESSEVLSILMDQVTDSMKRSRPREDRDREVFERLERQSERGNIRAVGALGLLFYYGQGTKKDLVAARERWEKAANYGDAQSMSSLALLYSAGEGVQRNYAKALELWQKAAGLGHKSAMRNIGILYYAGEGVAKDYAKAREWYEKAAAAGHADAMSNIAALYENGEGVAKDYAKAREWYEKAVAAGSTDAMVSIGTLYYYGQGVSQDYEKAREWYEKAAAAGSADAMLNIGGLYYNGNGVSQDYAKAREWYESAAAAGSAGAMNRIATLYKNSEGVVNDYAKAREWYEKAAAAGYAEAANEIGVLYYKGEGMAQDYAKAREWYERAAAANVAVAMYNMGQLYYSGNGVSQDYAKAREWYQKAAAKGGTSAMIQLGFLYANGLGISRDSAKARDLFQTAASDGNSDILREIAILYESGDRLPRDFPTALDFYQKAATAGDAEAADRLGQLYAEGRELPQDYAKAREWFRRAANAGDISREATATNSNVDLQSELAASYSRVGSALHAKGDLTAALTAIRKGEEINYRLSRTDPGNLNFQRELVRSRILAGTVMMSQDKPAEALSACQDGLTTADRLSKNEPSNLNNQRLLASSHNCISVIYYKTNNLNKALSAAESANSILISIPRETPSFSELQADLDLYTKRLRLLKARFVVDKVESEMDSIDAIFNSGDFNKAAELQTDLTESTEKLETVIPGGGHDLRAMTQSMNSWYRLFTREFDRALTAAERGLKIAPPNSQGQTGLVSAMNRAHALMFLGRAKEARAAYLEHRKELLGDRGAWSEVVLKDFAEFEKRGLTHPQMAEIRALLDYSKAYELYEKASAKGDEGAALELSRLAGAAALEQFRLRIRKANLAGHNEEALVLQEALAAEIEEEETKNAGKPGEKTASELVLVSWQALLARKFAKSLAASDRVFRLHAGDLVAETNRAHALLFLGRISDAQTLYLAHKGQPISSKDNRRWEQVIAENFVELRKAGLTHPMMAKIEGLLGVASTR